jgi:hypothetical protein
VFSVHTPSSILHGELVGAGSLFSDLLLEVWHEFVGLLGPLEVSEWVSELLSHQLKFHLEHAICFYIHKKCFALFPWKPQLKFKNLWTFPPIDVTYRIFSPPLWASLHLYLSPLFSGICKVKTFLLNLSVKCWCTAFNAQGSRLIIVAIQLGAVKIYVVAAAAAVEALRKKGKTGWNSIYYQNWWFSQFRPPLNANVLQKIENT